ncbi:hypothetical protein [Nocardia brasiliensis]|uniref:hypothetical protein n=1 Tax=Nocardia brasiliensis TaxID=37326 RepID=UPI0004A6AC74|nr:hypothetical protein [Nocardia brasiliensis]
MVYAIAKSAGFYAAHGIWSVSDGDMLTPLLGYAATDGTEGLERLHSDDAAEAAHIGAERLQTGRPNWVRAVLIVDAFLHLPRGRTDALIIDAVEYTPRPRSMRMAVPYRPQSPNGKFAVYRPKFIDTQGFTDPDYSELADSFYAGVDSHQQAAAVWHAHLLDESA